VRLPRSAGAALAAAIALAGAPGARAADAAADAAFVRGQRLEEALGDLEGALAAFRAAAGSEDPARRAAALLRGARVLGRLDRAEEARAALEALLADPAASSVPGARESARGALEALGSPAGVPESPEILSLRGRMRAIEEESHRRKRELEEALRTTAEVEPLRAALREKDEELRLLRGRLRDAEREARGGVGDLSEREREERSRQDADSRRVLSAEWTRYGRDFYMAGRFEDARRFLRDAVDLDPENAEARDLLARLSADNGDREAVVRGILEVHALGLELRAEQYRAEANSHLEEGRRLLAAGKPAEAMERFEAALARLVPPVDLRERLAPLRAEAARLFDEAAAKAGSKRRAPPPPEAAPADDPRWQEAVRAVLEQAGSAGEAGGATLRIFPLGPAIRAQRDALPPSPEAGSPPRGFALSAEVPALGPLLREAVGGAVEPKAWRAPGAVLEGVGTALVARAGPKAMEAVAKAVAGLSAPAARSLVVRATAIPCDPAVLVAAAAKAGVSLAPLPRGAGASAVLDPAAADAILSLLGGPGSAAADALFRVPENRAFVVEAVRTGAAGQVTAALRLRGLGWHDGEGGIAAGLEVACEAPGPPGVSEALGAPVLSRQEAAAGAALAPGGALLLAGLVNPLPDGGRHLALLVRFGEGAPLPAGAERVPAEAVVPLGDLPARGADRPGPLDEAPADGGRAARAEAIRRWVARRLPAGGAVRVDGTALRIQAPPAAADLVAADLERLRGGEGAASVAVRAWALDAKSEASLLRGFPLLEPAPGSPVRFVRLTGEDRRRHLFLVEGLGKRLALGVEGPLRLEPARRAALGRAEGAAPRLAGIEVGVRSWPPDRAGETTLWIDLAVRRAEDAATARGPEARVSLPADTALLFVGLPNPFADAGTKTRVAVWIETAE
jgi:tetratricopeptide (TPR) repeat protein